MNAPIGSYYSLFQQSLPTPSSPAHGHHFGDPLALEKGQDLPKITPIGTTARKLPFLIPRTPFRSPEELFLEGYAGGHDTCRSALLKIKKPSDCEQWKDLFSSLAATNIQSAVDTKKFVLGIRLSGTHPLILPCWIKDQLPPSNLAFAWKGAQLASWNPVAEDSGTAIVSLPLPPASTTLTSLPKSPPAALSPVDTTNSDNAASQSASVSVFSASQSQNSLAVSTATSSVSSVSFPTPIQPPTSLKKSSLRVFKLASSTPLASTRIKISPSLSAPSSSVRQ
jgi:hypothetical protein